MIIDFLLDDIRKAIADIGGEVSGLTAESFASVDYVSSAKTIYFYNAADEEVGSIDTTDFVVDGMIDTVSLSGNVLHFVFNTDAGKQPIDVDLSSVMPDLDEYWTSAQTEEAIAEAISGITPSDPTRLLSVEELPTSAETGTVMALYKEGEAGGGTWKLSQDGSYYYFDCDFSTLDQTQEYPLGIPFDIVQPVPTWDGDFILYYNNGWRIKNGYEVDDGGEEPVHHDVDFPLSPSAGVTYGGEWECETATGDPDNPYIQAIFEWNNVAEQLEVRSSGRNFNDPGMCQPDLKNIAGEAGEPVLGLYQYDGQNWNEVGGNTEDIELPIAAAVNDLKGNIEARLGQQYYKKAEVDNIAARKVEAGQVNAQIHNYVDPAIEEVNDTIEDKELATSAALNDLNTATVKSSVVKNIWSGTQNEYDAIVVKDPATLYIIKD